jgi:hypothetical protein
MAVSVNKHSRLRFTQILTIDGVEFWDMLDLPVIPIQPDDIQYQVQTQDRIDSLAFKFYGDPVLWWVIAYVNKLELVPNDLNVGAELRIPSPSYVQNVLFKKVST